MSIGRKIAVIIEPDRSLSYVMSAVLKRNGYDVISEQTVEKVLKLMKGKEIKVILVAEEIRTSKFNGLDVCRVLNTNYKGRVPVIVTSRSPTEEIVIRSIKSGALELLVKPVSEQVLLGKIKVAMNRGNTQFIVPDNLKDLDFPEGVSLSEMIDIVINEAEEIRALPNAVAKITQVSQDEKSGAQAMEKAITSDASITAMILKKANSAFYKGKTAITSVKQAVVRIGFDECRKMVLGFSVFKLFSNDDKSFGFNRLEFWLHSVAVAVLAEILCKKNKVEKSEDIFLAGLLHDFGKLLLDDYLSAHFQRALQLANINNLTLYESENNVFERSHNAVSKAIMEKWNFPEHIVNAALRHHVKPKPDPQKGLEPNFNDSLFLANQMAKVSLLGNGGDAIATPISDITWSAYGFKDNEFDEKFVEEYFSKVDEFLEFLGIKPSDLGREVKPEKQKGVILFVRQKGQDHRSITFFLQCQGFNVISQSESAEITKDLDLICSVIQLDDRDMINEVSKEIFSKYPERPILCLTGKLRYSNSLIPPSILKIIEGRLDFQVLRLSLPFDN